MTSLFCDNSIVDNSILGWNNIIVGHKLKNQKSEGVINNMESRAETIRMTTAAVEIRGLEDSYKTITIRYSEELLRL